MANVNVENNLRELQMEAELIQYKDDLDIHAITIGLPTPFLSILRYLLIDYSSNLTSYLSLKGYEFYSRSDFRFLQGVYRILMQEFQKKPMLTKQMFLAAGNCAIKANFTTSIIRLCRELSESIGEKMDKAIKMSAVSLKPSRLFPPNLVKLSSSTTIDLKENTSARLLRDETSYNRNKDGNDDNSKKVSTSNTRETTADTDLQGDNAKVDGGNVSKFDISEGKRREEVAAELITKEATSVLTLRPSNGHALFNVLSLLSPTEGSQHSNGHSLSNGHISPTGHSSSNGIAQHSGDSLSVCKASLTKSKSLSSIEVSSLPSTSPDKENSTNQIQCQQCDDCMVNSTIIKMLAQKVETMERTIDFYIVREGTILDIVGEVSDVSAKLVKLEGKVKHIAKRFHKGKSKSYTENDAFENYENLDSVLIESKDDHKKVSNISEKIISFEDYKNVSLPSSEDSGLSNFEPLESDSTSILPIDADDEKTEEGVEMRESATSFSKED